MVPSYAVLKWCRHMKTYFLLVKILVVPWVEDKTKCRLVIETSRVLVPTSVGPQSLTMHCLHSHCQIISTYFCMFRCSFTHVQQVISWNVWKHRKKSKWCRSSSDIKNISVSSAWDPWTPSPWWPNHPTTHSIQVTNTMFEIVLEQNPKYFNRLRVFRCFSMFFSRPGDNPHLGVCDWPKVRVPSRTIVAGSTYFFSNPKVWFGSAPRKMTDFGWFWLFWVHSPSHFKGGIFSAHLEFCGRSKWPWTHHRGWMENSQQQWPAKWWI